MSDDHDYTSSSSSSRIQLLNDSNFSTWESTMEAVLKEKKFYKYVSGGIIIDSKNREDDQAVQGFIMARVSLYNETWLWIRSMPQPRKLGI